MFGKTRRLNRIFVGEEQLCLLSPLDHGGWLGPVKGLDNPEWIVGEVLAGGANAVLASPGFLQAAQKSLKPETGLVLRVSLTAGLSKQGTQETPIATLDSAIRMDADAVVVSVFFGREGDIEIFPNRKRVTIKVKNEGDRAIQVVMQLPEMLPGRDDHGGSR